nr:DEAD/DEAH box helicase [Ardenticatenales bacterium]
MNRLTISPNEVVYYQYYPEDDALEVRFQPDDGPVQEESVAEMPLISRLRHPESGTVLGVRVSSVQQFLLQKLVVELATLAHAYGGGAPVIEVAETPPEAAPPSSHRSRSRKKKDGEIAPVAAEAPVAETVEVGAEEAMPEISTEVVADLPTLPAEIVEAVEAAVEPQPAPVEEVPARSTRSRSRKKKDEPQAAPEPAAEMVATPEEAPTKARRSRSRKKSVPEVLPAVESSLEAVVAPADAESSVALAEAEEAPTKARRSRSRKKKSAPEAATATEASDLLATESVTSVAETEAVVAEEEPSDAAALVEPADEEEPGKSRRRRNRKKKKVVPEQEEVLAEAVAPVEPLEIEAEPTVEGTAEDKTAKRKRRRKRKRGKGTAEAEVAAPAARESGRPQPSPQSQPVAAKEMGRTQPQPQPSKEKRETDVASSPYKTAPIPGLETPDAFGFMNMNRLLGQAIAAMGFEEPTPIQRRAVPIGMTGRDIIGLAQTGTGKTMAFLIPAAHRLLMNANQDHRPRLLALVPTRELAVQVAEEAEFLSTHTDLRISTIYGGVSIDAQTKELKRGTDIIVATPGRLLDHLNRGNVKLDTVEVLVLDEADRMLDMGFLPEIRTIVRKLPTERQTLLFSATMPPAIQSLSMDFQRDPEVIEVARQLPPATIEQHLY